MSVLRISLRTLMVIVGLAAVDLAACRALWNPKHTALAGIALTGLLLNAGLYLIVRARARPNAFWVGFLLTALLAAGSYAWAMTYPKLSATFFDIATGKTVTIHTSGAPLSDEWDSYLNFVEQLIEGLPDKWNPFLSSRFIEMLADASIAFAPQLIAAILGGLLFWLMTPVLRAAIRAVRARTSKIPARRFESAAP
jgi:hypothetical protein